MVIKMKIIKRIAGMKIVCAEAKKVNKIIGFVPTMGALHEGHLKLVDTAKTQADFVVVSIFVNPLQFGVDEDFERYPRNFEQDTRLLESSGVDVSFIPDAEEMYPPGYDTYIEVPALYDVLCGKSRPDHFKGVCTIVCKLFNIVTPDIAVFGEKDAQQAIIIEKMSEELNLGVKILTVPTVREADGLALSSRNAYLSPQERGDAVVLYQSLLMAKELIEKGERNAGKIKLQIHTLISGKATAKTDYIEIVRKGNLTPLDTLEGEVLIALAVWFGRARLIDNMTIFVDKELV